MSQIQHIKRHTALLRPSPFQPSFAAGMLDQNIPHGICGGFEKMGAIDESLRSGQPHICLMNECGCLKCMFNTLLGHAISRQDAKFLIYLREKIGGIISLLAHLSYLARR